MLGWMETVSMEKKKTFWLITKHVKKLTEHVKSAKHVKELIKHVKMLIKNVKIKLI